MSKILIVDDEKEIRKVIRKALEQERHLVYEAANVAEAREFLTVSPDIILLDVMMPETDGFEFCKEIRNKVDAPILFLTAKSQPEDLVFGFAVGGDDYIKKPFSLQELKARINAHLRREKREKIDGLSIGDFFFHLGSYELFYQEEKIELTKTEYQIAELLARNKGQVFSKDMIYEKLWGYDSDGYSETVVEHVRNLRKKILLSSEREPILTVWGVGYKWK